MIIKMVGNWYKIIEDDNWKAIPLPSEDKDVVMN
jgi:hypothetical protein